MPHGRLSNNTAEADQKLQDAKETLLNSISTFIDTVFRIQKEKIRRAATSAAQESSSQSASSERANTDQPYSSNKEESSSDEQSNSNDESSSDEQDYSISIEEEVGGDEEDNVKEEDSNDSDKEESNIKEESIIDEQDGNNNEEVALRARMANTLLARGIRKILDEMRLESEDDHKFVAPQSTEHDSEIQSPPLSQTPRRSQRIKSSSSRSHSTTNH